MKVKNSSQIKAGVLNAFPVASLGHSKKIRKCHDGAEVQKSRNKGQYCTLFCFERVHFFHAELDFTVKKIQVRNVGYGAMVYRPNRVLLRWSRTKVTSAAQTIVHFVFGGVGIVMLTDLSIYLCFLLWAKLTKGQFGILTA
jgi:hypothetical protein